MSEQRLTDPRLVIHLRHKVYAHTDADTPRRGVATYDVLMASGAGAIGEWLVQLEPDECLWIAVLAIEQGKRFWNEMRSLGQEVRRDHGVVDLGEDSSGAIVAIIDAKDPTA